VGRRAPDDGGTAGDGVDHRATDLTNRVEVERLVREVGDRHGPVSILVHAAGVFVHGNMDSAAVDDLDRQYAVNLRAPFVLTQLLLRDLTATGGDVVFINSATTGRAGVSQYAATKFGLRALADSLRDELNPLGGRVTTVHLGRTATDMQQAIHDVEGRPYEADRLVQPEDVARTVLHAVTLRATAQISEVWILPRRRV
jgi:NAD(P)-dependent dehydrogenase (short-subunit alcohol dehydrogenase family)